jgi:aspartyl-tRNA(Asn)/glutamyl-tRNA(Gln) amidotransferase subunit A
LALHVSALGLGTDTAGSLRIPSACCGTVGFKPPHGKVPIDGCLPLSPTLDVAGPMTRTVADCARAYSVLAGQREPEPRLDGLVVGILERVPRMSPHEPGLPPATEAVSHVDEWARQLEALGARTVAAELPEPEADLLPILLHEAAVAHRETFPSRRADYGPDTQLKWDVARKVPAIDVHEAQLALPRWRERARSEAVDLYLSPVVSVEVPPIDVWEPDVRVSLVTNTRSFSFLGWPAIAIGNMQLAGPDESTVLAAALAWEAAGGVPQPAGS